jgi:hypothetical protein
VAPPRGVRGDAERIAELEAEIDRLRARRPLLEIQPSSQADHGAELPPKTPPSKRPDAPALEGRHGLQRRGASLPSEVPEALRGTPRLWLDGMRRALERGDDELATYCRMALVALGDEATAPALAVLEDDGETDAMRARVLSALRELAPGRLAEAAAAWLSTPRDAGALRTAMLRQLSEHAGELPQAVSNLAWDADAPRLDRDLAISALMNADAREASDLLQRMLRDGGVSYDHAVELLGRTTNADMRDLVVETARTGDEKVKRSLIGALAAMKGPGWGDVQMTGPPDTPIAGDNRTAWASLEPQEGLVTVEVDFPYPVVPEQLRIHETFNPGAVVRIEALIGGARTTLWEGEPAASAGTRWFAPRLGRTGDAAQSFRLTLDTDAVQGWNEIDAVELVGDGERQWASRARSSSCYARR